MPANPVSCAAAGPAYRAAPNANAQTSVETVFMVPDPLVPANTTRDYNRGGEISDVAEGACSVADWRFCPRRCFCVTVE